MNPPRIILLIIIIIQQSLIIADNSGDLSTNLFTFLNEHETLCFLEEVSKGSTWIAGWFFFFDLLLFFKLIFK